MQSSIDKLIARIEYLGITDPEVLRLVSDISSKHESHTKRLSAQSKELYFDSLTGLPNKSNFIAYIHSQLEKRRHKKSSSAYLAFGDMNNFKSINDRFGHSEGDKALKHVANILQEVCRESDFVSRLHGDEFGFVFNRIKDMADAQRARNRFKQALESCPFEVCGEKIILSMSIGIVPYNTSVSIEENLELADLAMYREKGLR